MDQTKRVEAEAGDVGVVDEVIAFLGCLIFWPPVTADSQHLASALLDRHDVRTCNPRRLALLVRVLITCKVELNLHLKQAEPIVLSRAEAQLLSNLLLDLIQNA